MRNFKIQLNINGTWTTITNSEDLTPVSSFDEKLVKQPNDRHTLTFSLMKKVNIDNSEVDNYFAENIFISSTLRYIEYKSGSEPEIVDLIVTKKDSKITGNNVQYNITSEDWFSQKLAKVSEGFSVEVLNGTLLEIAETLISNSEMKNIKISINKPHISFKSIVDNKDIRNTFIVDNSNLYNALVELSILFNAEMKYIYSKSQQTYATAKDSIIFYDKTNFPFRGYRLRPDSNLKSLSPNENNQNFTTALKVQGKEGVSLPPVAPVEVTQFFSSQVDFSKRGITDTEFSNFKVFKTNEYSLLYNEDPAKSLIEHPTYATEEKNLAARGEIKKFLKLCDLLPAYNNIFYNFDYYYYNKRLLPNSYLQLKNYLFNELRKCNIKIAMATNTIISSNTRLNTFEGEILTYATYLSAECRYYNSLVEKEASQSMKDNSLAKINFYNETLSDIYKYKTNNDFHTSIVYSYGFDPVNYASKNTLGFRVKVTEYEDKIDKFLAENNEIIERVEYINERLETEQVFSVKITLEAEKAGLENKKKANDKQIETTKLSSAATTDRTILNNGIGVQRIIQSLYLVAETSYVDSASPAAIPSLYNLLYQDEPSSPSLITLRQEIMNEMYLRYGSYLFESTYTNSEEVSAYGLLEQSFLIMYGTTETDLFDEKGFPNEKNLKLISRNEGYRTPNMTFSISYIDMTAFDEFDFLQVRIGDKIELHHPSIGLKGLVVEVSGITIDLRKPDNCSLSIQNLNEGENILQKLLALL